MLPGTTREVNRENSRLLRRFMFRWGISRWFRLPNRSAKSRKTGCIAAARDALPKSGGPQVSDHAWILYDYRRNFLVNDYKLYSIISMRNRSPFSLLKILQFN
jgi:hypothetical protein